MAIARFAAALLLLSAGAHAQVGQHPEVFALGATAAQRPQIVIVSTYDTTRNTGNLFSFSSDRFTATLQVAAPVNNDSSAFTTGFHSDVKRFFRFTLRTFTTPCDPGLGIATSTEINGQYLGHSGNQSFGVFSDGATSINGAPANVSHTGITLSQGDVIDFIVDPVAKTIQEVKNGGTPSAAIDISGLTSQNISPAISPCAAGDSIVYNGNPFNVSYPGAIAWDAPAPAPVAPQFTSVQMSNLTFTSGSTNAVGTATATVSSGPNTPTWSIVSSGIDHGGTACVNYGTNFAIGSSTGVVTPAAGNTAQSYPGVCIQAAQTGLTSYVQAFQLVGQAAGVGSVFDTTRNTSNHFTFSNNSATATEVDTAPANSNYSAFTTGFHSDVKRFYRFTINANLTCGGTGLQEVGAASSTEINGNYLGHTGGNSFGVTTTGTVVLNNGVPGNTGVSFGQGDVVDLAIDPVAKTVQESKNGGPLGTPVDISGLVTQNVSPAYAPCAANDMATFAGTVPGFGYNGVIAWDSTSTGPQFTSIAMSNKTFISGGTAPVGTASATVSSGTNAPTWTIKTSGTDSLGNTCNNYGADFTINSSTGVVTPAVGAPVQSYPGFCPQAAQSGLTTYSQATTLTGQAPTPLTVSLTPSSATEVCNVPGNTAVSTVTTGGGDGNPITLSLTAGATDFALSSTTLPANVTVASGGITTSGFACASLPTGGATETVTVQASQP